MIKPFYKKDVIEALNDKDERTKALIHAYIDAQLTNGNLSINLINLQLTCSIEVINEVVKAYEDAGWILRVTSSVYSFVWNTQISFIPR